MSFPGEVEATWGNVRFQWLVNQSNQSWNTNRAKKKQWDVKWPQSQLVVTGVLYGSILSVILRLIKSINRCCTNTSSQILGWLKGQMLLMDAAIWGPFLPFQRQRTKILKWCVSQCRYDTPQQFSSPWSLHRLQKNAEPWDGPKCWGPWSPFSAGPNVRSRPLTLASAEKQKLASVLLENRAFSGSEFHHVSSMSMSMLISVFGPSNMLESLMHVCTMCLCIDYISMSPGTWWPPASCCGSLWSVSCRPNVFFMLEPFRNETCHINSSGALKIV